MTLPRCEIIRAVDRNTSALRLTLGLVLAKQPKLAGLLVDRHTSSMGIDQITVRVMPPAAGNDIFAGREASKGHESPEA